MSATTETEHERDPGAADALRELEELAHVIAHDLRAPLRAVDGYAQMLAEDESASISAQGQRHLAELRAAARRLGLLLDGVVGYLRLPDGGGRQPVDMFGLALEVAAGIEEAGLAGRVRIDIEPLPPVVGDRAQLRLLWTHLLGNAVKFSAGVDRPRVRVGSRSDASGPIYTVEDNGAGFDMRYADRLFRLFQRLHHPADFEGAGTGLAIARRIVAGHGGRIRAASPGGQGALVEFHLPPARATADRDGVR